MTGPVRRGTASRLGLRTPYARPHGFITSTRTLSDDEARQLKAAFDKLQHCPSRIAYLPTTPSGFRVEVHGTVPPLTAERRAQLEATAVRLS